MTNILIKLYNLKSGTVSEIKKEGFVLKETLFEYFKEQNFKVVNLIPNSFYKKYKDNKKNKVLYDKIVLFLNNKYPECGNWEELLFKEGTPDYACLTFNKDNIEDITFFEIKYGCDGIRKNQLDWCLNCKEKHFFAFVDYIYPNEGGYTDTSDCWLWHNFSSKRREKLALVTPKTHVKKW